MHWQIADRARNEYVLAVKGKVVERDAETVNANLATGEIEVQVTEIEIMNAAKTPPFFIEDGVEVDESVRLKYRYLGSASSRNAEDIDASFESVQNIP